MVTPGLLDSTSASAARWARSSLSRRPGGPQKSPAIQPQRGAHTAHRTGHGLIPAASHRILRASHRGPPTRKKTGDDGLTGEAVPTASLPTIAAQPAIRSRSTRSRRPTSRLHALTRTSAAASTVGKPTVTCGTPSWPNLALGRSSRSTHLLTSWPPQDLPFPGLRFGKLSGLRPPDGMLISPRDTAFETGFIQKCSKPSSSIWGND